MEFEAYRRPELVRVLEAVYDLEEVAGLSRRLDGVTPFLRSRKAWKRRQVFSLPFGFYQTASSLAARWHVDEWARLDEWSRVHATNVTVTTVGALDRAGGALLAHNPILVLQRGHDPIERCSRNLRSNLRKERNKAHRHGVVIEASGDRRDLRAFYELLARQYVREHRMVFQPWALFDRLFGTDGPGRLLIARQSGRVVGGLFMIADGPGLHYNWGARAPLENLSVGTLLLDHAIRSAAEQGHAWFDLGSTPLSDQALLDFKLRWGADDHPVWRYHTLRAVPPVDLNASFRAARAVYARLPVPVAARLMPVVVPWLVG